MIEASSIASSLISASPFAFGAVEPAGMSSSVMSSSLMSSSLTEASVAESSVRELAAWVPWSACVRTFAILRAQVIWRRATGPAWWLVALGLALVLAPMTTPVESSTGEVPAVEVLLAELAMGTVIGWIVALPGHALLGAATQTGTVVGLSGRGGSTWAASIVVWVLAMSMAAGLHHTLIAALVTLGHVLPPGQVDLVGVLDVGQLALALHAFALLALTLAAPALLIVMVVELVTGWLVEPSALVLELAWLRRFAIVAGSLVALGAASATFPEVWASTVLPP